MRFSATATAKIFERVVEGMREIGVLLLAFAPLEFTLQGDTGRPLAMILFAATGLGLWVGSLYMEVRQYR